MTWETYEMFKVGETGMTGLVCSTLASNKIQTAAWHEMLSPTLFPSAWTPMLEFKSSQTSLNSLRLSRRMARPMAWAGISCHALLVGGLLDISTPAKDLTLDTDRGKGLWNYDDVEDGD